MHRDLARYLVLLTVVRVLVVVAAPAPHPWPVTDRDRRVHLQTASRAGEAGRVERALRARRPARPRPGGPAATDPGCYGGVLAPGCSADRSPSAVAGTQLTARPPGSDHAHLAGQRSRRGRTHRGRRSRHRQRGSRRGGAWSAGNGKLLICTLNIQSVKPKTVELSPELQRFGYDIAVLCETWLRPNVPNRLVVFPGYTLHRSDRKFAPKGYGGVAVLSRDGIEAKRISVPASASNQSRLETLWSLFRWNRSKVVIGAVYRQPRNTGFCPRCRL